MPAAARVLDTSNHGGTITGPGEATVLVGSMVAGVLGDTHVCVIPIPHPMVSVFPAGSGTVLIGGRPALRTTDACICGGMAAVGELASRMAGPGVPDFVTQGMAAILVLESLDACCEASNTLAPEHLLLAVQDEEGAAARACDYGALFLGYEATVPFGDYLAGPNHVSHNNFIYLYRLKRLIIIITLFFQINHPFTL